MGYKKTFLVVLTSLVLVCAIPFTTVSATWVLSPYDSRIMTYTYRDLNYDASTSPWFHVTGKHTSGDSTSETVDFEKTGRIHCRGGHVYKAFMIFIPFEGYYLVVVQDGPMHIDLNINGGTEHAFLTATLTYKNGNTSLSQDYRSWYGDGYLTHNNVWLFQTVLFGYYLVFYNVQISNSSSPSSHTRYSVDNYAQPTSSEKDAITGFINDHSSDFVVPGGSATAEFLDGQKGESETFPDGTPVPTNDNGNPAPTDQFGQPAETLNNGMPYPTYPNGEKASTYVDPSGNIQTVPYTIVDNGAVQSDVNNQFDKLNSMISDLDSASSLMESNQDELSAHVDNTRDLVDGIMSWFPAPLIAVLVCGVIMIIAVKITGSGASV